MGCAHGTVGIYKLYRGARYVGESLAEDRAEEHVGVAGVYALDFHTHALHYFHTVHKGEHYSFLRGADYVATGVYIEVDAVYRATCLAVFEHALCAVAERQHRHSAASCRHFGCKQVHVGIADTGRGYIALNPRIEYACAVYAGHHAYARSLGAVVDVGKIIDARTRIVVDSAVDAVYHSRSAGGRGNLARFEHIER